MRAPQDSKVEDPAFVAVLKACAKKKDLQAGSRVHATVLRLGLLEKNLYIANTVISMYAKCGDLHKARQVLEELPVRDVVSWSALITGYAELGQGEEALECVDRMQQEGLSPNTVTLISILKACGSVGSAAKGEQIHKEIARRTLLEDSVVVGTALVDMYVKCGELIKARRVLDELPNRDAIALSALIAGYAQLNQGQHALNCYQQMLHDGLSPDAVTFVSLLKACASLEAIDLGEEIHDQVKRQGLLGKGSLLGNALVDMYSKCGYLGKARQVLEELPGQDIVSWNALITGHAQQGQGKEALQCFELLKSKGLSPDVVTYTSILKACGGLGAIDKGQQLHDDIISHGWLENNVVLGNALVDMYAKCGALSKAKKVLDELPIGDIVSWSALISGYILKGQGEDALDCYQQMQHQGFSPDIVTFACILKACNSVGAADKGERIHKEIARQGLLGKDIMLGNSLVAMYVRCNALAKAQRLLEDLPSRDVVSWSTLIAGYAQQGQGEEALKCYEQMQRDGFSPNEITFTSVLKACASIGAAEKGIQIHEEILRRRLLGDNFVLLTALVNMYAKCGKLKKAKQVLVEHQIGNVVSWSALAAGYTQKGQWQDAMSCFVQMQQKGFTPNVITLTSVLNAFNHLRLINESQSYLAYLSINHGIMPDLKHYISLIDLFGRAGHFDKAVAMIERVPSSGHPAVWSTLLGGCWKWGGVNFAIWAFDRAVQVF